MPTTFEFDDNPWSGPLFAPTTPSYSFTEDGVDFIWSASNGGSGNAYYEVNPNSDGYLGFSASSGAGDTFTLEIAGTTMNFTGTVQLNVTSVSGVGAFFNVTFHGANGTPDVTQNNVNSTGTVSAGTGGSQYSHITFTTPVTPTVVGINDITVGGISCFCEGTRIATPDGFKPVEGLVAGDVVLTPSGRTTVVQWIGTQFIDTRLRNPAAVNPICISAGALGDNSPERDLYLSPDHAIELDGYLVNAAALVNGSTIHQVGHTALDGFTYYHVETNAHELISVEGVAAESYLDAPSRELFDNGHERADGPVIQEMTLPRISARRLLPKSIETRLSEVCAGTSVHEAA